MNSTWVAKPLGDMVILEKGVTYASSDYSDQEGGLPFITIKCVEKGGGFDWTGLKYYSGPYSTSQKLKPGDILIALTDLTRAGDIIGSPVRVPEFPVVETALASMDLCKLKASEAHIDLGFLYHRLMMSDVRSYMQAHSGGSTVLHLENKSIPKLSFNCPPLPEQRKIAKILTTVDNLIEKTEALIAKYQAIKQGMMHDLFTRGVDAHGHLRPPYDEAPELYKESERGWIPREWVRYPLGDLAQYLNGNSFKANNWSNHGLPIIRIQNLNDEQEFNFYDGPVDDRWHIFPGDLLFAWAGMRQTSFGPRIWKGREGVLNQHIFKVIPNLERLSKQFLHLLLQYNLERIVQLAHGFKDSFVHITRSELTSVIVFVLTQDEQSKIVTIVQKLESLITANRKTLDNSRKIKTGLMQDLLTGNVRVQVDDPQETLA